LPLSARDTVREVAGEYGERIAFVNCTMDRATFDAFVIEHQEGTLRGSDRHLYAVHLCDWLDQVPFNREWNYRRVVYATIAEQLGSEALTAFEWVYRGR
jgi:hypothetical protein